MFCGISAKYNVKNIRYCDNSITYECKNLCTFLEKQIDNPFTNNTITRENINQQSRNITKALTEHMQIIHQAQSQ